MDQRTIKFRAYDDYLGKYVDSSFATLQLRTGTPDVPHSDTENIILEQFTGLLDKNGTEIYEGDVVHCEDEMYALDKAWRTDEHKAIKFENGGFRFDGLVLGDMIGADPLTFEVIGNIHENSELLT